MISIIRKSIILLILSTLFIGFDISEGREETPEASGELGVFSKYVWRGLN